MEPAPRHRTAILDVGSFSARLVAVEPTRSLSQPVVNERTRLRLDRAVTAAGCLEPSGIAAIANAVDRAQAVAAHHGLARAFPLATSSIRDAPNAAAVVQEVAAQTGVRLRLLSGAAEAAWAYRACRGWFGAAQGRLMLVDIGGGTLELAAGAGDQPEAAHSVALGARTVSNWCSAETLSPAELSNLRSCVYERAQHALTTVNTQPSSGTAVGCSKTLRQLARLTTPQPAEGRTGTLRLDVGALQSWMPTLAALSARQRAELPGITAHRARQTLGGAIVAEALLLACHQTELWISPWSTREGLLAHLSTQPPTQVPTITPPGKSTAD